MRSNVRQTLNAFLDGSLRNAWLGVETTRSPLRVYVRKGRHSFERQLLRCLDVASVQVENPGQGAFTEFLDEAECIANQRGFQAVFAEGLIEPRLYSFFLRRGYVVTFEGEGDDKRGANLVLLFRR